MSIKPPFPELDIKTEDGGFYKDTSLPIALFTKISSAPAVATAYSTTWAGHEGSDQSAVIA